ncbi:hypothetical protein L195_g019483 [Trifolium pratense]|uniref:B3 domain-containing protein n=1 Tax=Trifolium pratense TaxID=57577 RepID=A0A2K3MZR2_TRIPR|nr:hypothetical protein L195_g019483 [Trifolium pratense]
MDDTYSATFVVFDKEASGIFNMSCADMLKLGDITTGERIVPPQIDDTLVNQTWLFKVEAKPSQNPRFEQSFRVRKICTDESIIKQFKDKWDNDDAEGGSLTTLLDKGKNVYVGGTSNVLSEECQNFSGDSDKGKCLIVDGTPVEVSQDLMLTFSESVVNLDDDSVNTPFCIKPMTSGVKQLTSASAMNPMTSALAVKPNTSDVAMKQTTSIAAVKPMNYVAAVKPTLFAGAAKPTISAVITQQSAAAVKPVNVTSGDDVSLQSSASARPCGQRKKSFSKRVSPQHEDQEVEDDNAPIKLLNRAVKIEKIPYAEAYMAEGAYEDINTIVGSRLQKCILTTIHVKDVPFGEIDPVFADKYSNELDRVWKVYAGNDLHFLTWNQSPQQPLITDGWTKLQPWPTNEFPSFHSLSTKLPEPLTFEIVLTNNSNGSREELVKSSPEPHLAEIIQTPGRNGVRKLEYQAWYKFCYDNCFSTGDLLKFTFFNIAKSNKVDVDVDRVVN